MPLELAKGGLRPEYSRDAQDPRPKLQSWHGTESARKISDAAVEVSRDGMGIQSPKLPNLSKAFRANPCRQLETLPEVLPGCGAVHLGPRLAEVIRAFARLC
jgi:hypothetical protein